MAADENVKSSNLIERAKEEIQVVIHSDKLHLHHKKTEINELSPIDSVKAPNVIDRAKEEIEALIQTLHPEKDHPKSNHKTEEGEAISHRNHHQRETHGRRDDIDENTLIDEIKRPSIFQRAKEEVEALIGMIHQKKEVSDSVYSAPPPVNEGGFRAEIGRGEEERLTAMERKRKRREAWERIRVLKFGFMFWV